MKVTYYFGDNKKYIGEVKDGLFHGNATITWADGNKYIGEFKYGIRNGFGIYHSGNGKINEQYWENGQYKSKDFKIE